MKLYAEISKVDDEQRMVYGVASTEALDVQGEVVTKEAMADAMDDYMKFANIREMHQPSAVGVAKSFEIDGDGRTHISVHVVDDSAWAKVKAGVYKGFSIGGKAISKVEGVIKSLRLSEISLVDRPANPEALITVWKADGVDPEANVAALAEMLDKGDISPARLIELAKADLAKAAEVVTDEAAKAETPVEILKGYIGEEVWDTATAMSALEQITSLIRNENWEAQEGEEEDSAAAKEQMDALIAAVAAIKRFIVSEIKEDNYPEAEAAEVGEIVEMSDIAGDIAKAGKTISASNMKKMQEIHDNLASLGVTCATAEKHDHDGDISKMATERDDAISKVASLEADLQKMNDELAIAKSEIEKFKAMPMPGKALLKSISKADDAGELLTDKKAEKIDPVMDSKGDINDAASLIKMIHSKGGVIVR
jgi:hypothetical protein